MLRRLNIYHWQRVTEGDFNNLGLFPEESLDAFLADLGPGQSFAGFGVAQSGPASVMLGPGRLYTVAGPAFYTAETPGAEISFIAQLPVVTQRWAAITVWGEEVEAATEPRTFLTDASTRATVIRVVATETRRHANHAVVYGPEGPDPSRPTVPASVLAVAWILLAPTGIVQIVPNEDARAHSLRTLGDRTAELDDWRTRTGTRLDTLVTDLNNLSGRLDGTAQLQFVLELSRDMARVKEELSLPADYSAWSSDHFLTTDRGSDLTHVDYMAKIEEGCRFPPAQERNAQVALLNAFEPTVTVQDNFVLPRYTEVPRIEVVGNDAELSIAQYSFQTVSWVQLAKTRMRLRFGTPFYWCSNSVWWDDWNSGVRQFDLTYDPIRNIMTRPQTGETFNILDGSYTDWPDHTVYRLQQFWVDEIVDEFYFDRVVTTEGLNGSVIGQTFLNSQEGWLTSVELFFTRFATTGDVRVMICETENGAPLFDRVIGSATCAVANLRPYPQPTKIDFVPVYLRKGRFALVLQTTGNHFVALTVNNKFAQGTLFHSTDGAWFQGDLERDMSFRLNFASFDATRVAVPLQPLELTNGIAAIDINVDSVRPGVCTTSFEIQVNGVWVPFGFYDDNPLNTLPPLLPLRVVFTGTTDCMPGIGVGPNGWAYTWRPRSDFRHISTVQTVPTPVNRVYVDLMLEQWRGAPHHTCQVRLLTGAGYTTVVTPAAVSDRPDPRDPLVINRSHTFTVPTTTSFRIRIEGTTDNVLTCYHVAERVQVSLFS